MDTVYQVSKCFTVRTYWTYDSAMMRIIGSGIDNSCKLSISLILKCLSEISYYYFLTESQHNVLSSVYQALTLINLWHAWFFFAALALDKPAYQISTHAHGYAGLAVDGLHWSSNCSHTNAGEYSAHLQWWIVDLEKEYSISEISVYGRVGQGMYHCLLWCLLFNWLRRDIYLWIDVFPITFLVRKSLIM